VHALALHLELLALDREPFAPDVGARLGMRRAVVGRREGSGQYDYTGDPFELAHVSPFASCHFSP
jgi:hypothetical protein